jgi:hypothetical protein
MKESELNSMCGKTVVGKPLKEGMPSYKLRYNKSVGLKNWSVDWICLDHDTN